MAHRKMHFVLNGNENSMARREFAGTVLTWFFVDVAIVLFYFFTRTSAESPLLASSWFGLIFSDTFHA